MLSNNSIREDLNPLSEWIYIKWVMGIRISHKIFRDDIGEQNSGC